MDDVKLMESLAGVPLFSRLDKKSTKKLAALCVPREFAEGEWLIREGDVGLGLYVLTSGEVQVVKGEGDGAIELNRVGVGSVIGEMALIDDQPRSASVLALEPTESLLISRESFSKLARKDPDIAWCIVPVLTERIRELDRRKVGETSEQNQENLEEAPLKIRRSEIGDSPRKGHGHDRRAWISEAALNLLRLQGALGVGAVEGLSGMLKVSKRFMTSLAEETDLHESHRIKDVVSKLPLGLLGATRAALTQGEKLPAAMAKSMRRFLARS